MYKPDVETVDLPGDDTPQGFVSYSDEEDITPKLFDMSSLPEGKSIYYISPEKNLFLPKEVQNLVIVINTQMIFFLYVAKDVVTVKYIIEMQNVENTLTEVARYIERSWCH